MTEQMSTEIVDILNKYDTAQVFTLDAFERVFKLTYYNNVLLKNETLKSTIMTCFNSYFGTFSLYVMSPYLIWESYVQHNATKSLMKYSSIQQNLKQVKGVAIHYAKYLVRSMLGFLYYAKYKESGKTKFLLASKRLIQKSLNLDNSYVKLRAATFFFTHLDYSQSNEICDKFLTFPPRRTSNCQFIHTIWRKVFDQLSKMSTTEEIENTMTEILPMFYSSVKLQSLPGNYESLVWIFRNFTNIFFHDLIMDVTFMTAEKWVIPDPIQYELLSLSQDADNEELPFSGIHLDPIFVCIQIKFLCYHSMGNVNGMSEMLTEMNSFITENIFTTQSICVYLNMLAYCHIKAGHHRQSAKYILQSLRIFPSRYNAASGYLKIVLQILTSLSI
jgi:hypothetical protein